MSVSPGRYAMLNAAELGSLGSIVELCNRLGFSPSLLLGAGGASNVSWLRSRSLRGTCGIPSCFRTASSGSKTGCGVGESLRVVSGLRNFNGVGLFTTTCSCGCRLICAFRSSTSANGGRGVTQIASSPDVRLVTLPPMRVRSDRRTQPHFLEGVAFSGTSGLMLRNALREHGSFVLRGFGA